MTKSAPARSSLRDSVAWALLASLGLTPACGAYRNQDERSARATGDAEVAKSLGVFESIPCGPGGTLHCCVRECVPDPGSTLVNCAKQEEGLEFMSPAIWDFEAAEATPGMYIYSDRSVYTGREVNDLQIPGSFLEPRGYQPAAAVTARCGGEAKVFRLRGGIFRGWGGGLGRPLLLNAGTLCGTTGCGDPVDVSAWDGISLWARRGPNGQSLLRIGLGDQHTDDDLNRAEKDEFDTLPPPRADGKLCRRVRSCDCPSGKPCTYFKNDAFAGRFCYDPLFDPAPIHASDHYPLCGDAVCNDPGSENDPSFVGKACTPFLTESGEEREFCFDKGLDPDPPESHQRCGDHWMAGIHLTADWQLFLIPFASLQQQGFGKNTPRLTTEAISMLRLTWDIGWIDLWIDDVRFYRVKR